MVFTFVALDQDRILRKLEELKSRLDELNGIVESLRPSFAVAFALHNPNGNEVNSTVYVDLPVHVLVPIRQKPSAWRLEDEDGNPVNFFLEANGRETYPGYGTIWFKAELPASSMRRFKLIYEPKGSTYDPEPTHFFDTYITSWDDSVLYDSDPSVGFDKYIIHTPDSSLYPMADPSKLEKKISGAHIKVNITSDYFVAKVNWYQKNIGAGHVLTFFNENKGTYAGPYLWFGSDSGPWKGYGDNLGYYSGSYEKVNQYHADGRWHRVMVFGDVQQKKFRFAYDSSVSNPIDFIEVGDSRFGPFDKNNTGVVLDVVPQSDKYEGKETRFDTFIFVNVDYNEPPVVVSYYLESV